MYSGDAYGNLAVCTLPFFARSFLARLGFSFLLVAVNAKDWYAEVKPSRAPSSRMLFAIAEVLMRVTQRLAFSRNLRNLLRICSNLLHTSNSMEFNIFNVQYSIWSLAEAGYSLQGRYSTDLSLITQDLRRSRVQKTKWIDKISQIMSRLFEHSVELSWSTCLTLLSISPILFSDLKWRLFVHRSLLSNCISKVLRN